MTKRMMTLTLLLSCTSGEVTPPGFLALGTLGEIQLQGATQQAREKKHIPITKNHIPSYFVMALGHLFLCGLRSCASYSLLYLHMSLYQLTLRH